MACESGFWDTALYQRHWDSFSFFVFLVFDRTRLHIHHQGGLIAVEQVYEGLTSLFLSAHRTIRIDLYKPNSSMQVYTDDMCNGIILGCNRL